MYKGFAFDVLLAVVALVVGLMSIIRPEKSWNLLQSKKVKSHTEPTEKTFRTMRIMGVALVLIAIIFTIFTVLQVIQS